MISITPIHRHSTPIMERHSSTPAAAPSSAPFATAGPFPVASPHRIAAPTITGQINDIAIAKPPFSACPPKTIRGGPGGYAPNPGGENPDFSTFFEGPRQGFPKIVVFLHYFG